nr:glucosyltransferase domain-containing protein [uncultured Acetatifactor sp.]
MKKIIQEANWFLHQKVYVTALALTAACSYGFAVTHHSIGIDDTAMMLYLEDGLEVAMGRWTVFLLNRIFHMAGFSPFMLELIGVVLLMLGVTLFGVFMRRVFGGRGGIAGYTIFACVFLSNPIISEVCIYYFHNGVDLGYVLCALALLFFLNGLEGAGRKRWAWFGGSLLWIWAAVGCYESFLIVYILGILILLFLRGATGQEVLSLSHGAFCLGVGALLSAGCVILRTVMIPTVIALFGLQDVVGVQAMRSLSEMLVLFGSREGLDNLLMLAKRFWLIYHVNAFVYLPVTGYVLALLLTGILALYMAVKKRNFLYLVLFGGMEIVPFLMTIAEAKVTNYRTCQFLPFFTAVGMLVLYMLFEKRKFVRVWRYGAIFLATALVYNQADRMNRSFYADYQKYENTREILNQVAWQVESRYGTDMPVIFTGYYDTPFEFRKDFYVSYSSWQYRAIAGMTDLVDVHLKEKYFAPEGYSFVGEALSSFIAWGVGAFDGTNREMIRFLEMHGHALRTVTDPEVIEEAQEIGETMPKWPREGSITEQDGYILIHM